MTEPTKDKDNGKDQKVPVAQVDGIEPYLMIGKLKSTGQVTLAGQPIEELMKFKEKKTILEVLFVFIDAMVVIKNLYKQFQKKQSPILRVARNIILPGGTHE